MLTLYFCIKICHPMVNVHKKQASPGYGNFKKFRGIKLKS